LFLVEAGSLTSERSGPGTLPITGRPATGLAALPSERKSDG
jgi:hypothetical protein